MHLYLIRHGQSYINLTDWDRGNLDEGLTELGQRQARALGRWLPTLVPEIDAIYASTMARARETAEEVAKAYNQDIRFDDRLRELGNNRLDHTPWPSENLPQQFSDYWASERPFSPITPEVEHGETFMHFRTRVGMFIEDLVQRHENETVVVVCHGGVLESAFDHIFNVGPWRRAEVWMHNTAVTHFEYIAIPRRETWRLHFHNRVDHLLELEGPDVARN
ncbi:MAG: histidine phosphatase family protein [Chloroflexota bacterium]|nr:histidine phosphatase family protein [Chloroflexota bacterium]